MENTDYLVAYLEQVFDSAIEIEQINQQRALLETTEWQLDLYLTDNLLVISKLRVPEEIRLQGHGRALVDALLAFAGEHDQTVIAQAVLPDKAAFWRRLDFVPSQHIPKNYIKQGH